MELDKKKDEVRRLVLSRRGRLSPAERAARGAAAAERLFSLPSLAGARAALAFASFGSEIPTDPILERLFAAGARVYLPYVAGSGDLEMAQITTMDDLVPGYRGIREPGERIPAASGAIDVAVVPGVAFDAAGRRLGYGGGFFDRFLATLPRRVPRVGVCFDLQVVDVVPAAEHDERADYVVTEERVIDCRPQQPSA